MSVLVDIGNTRLKWARLEDGRLVDRGSAVHRDSVDAAFAAFAAALPAKPGRVIAANVAGDAIAARLKAVVAARPGSSLELVATTAERFGVRCAYADPRRLGVDRWIAVLAAYNAARGAACVAQAGTAVTFDAVDARGMHLGGLILPGSRLLPAALDRHTSDIGSTAATTAVPRGLDLLGRNTDAAVGNGAWLALGAALDRAATTVADALGVEPVVYLTGGDADALAGWLETRVEIRADLVLEGLALFAAAVPGEGR
jgi:type III pantothenate kinase